MVELCSLPREVLLEIFAHLPFSDLVSVGRTCAQLCDLSKRPLATRIETSVSADFSYEPEPGYDITCYNPCILARTGLSSSELDTAADLVTTGHLSDDAMTALAARLQCSWIARRCTYFNQDNLAELRCAAALAATGHLTSVKYLILENLELPSSEDISSLARTVQSMIDVTKVTGDIAPLVTSLHCVGLTLNNMGVDQAATSSLVQCMRHGVKRLYLGLPMLGSDKVRLDIETLLEYDGRGRCEEVVCYFATLKTYGDQLSTWAARVDWAVNLCDEYMNMKRK